MGNDWQLTFFLVVLMDERTGLWFRQIHKAEAGLSPTRVEDSSNADLWFHDHGALGLCCEECNPVPVLQSQNRFGSSGRVVISLATYWSLRVLQALLHVNWRN